jgi:hypothetical protein
VLVGDDDPRHVAHALEELAKEALGAPRLDENIQYVDVLIDSSPEVVASIIDAGIDLVQMPLVAPSRRAAAQLVGEVLSELQAPLPGVPSHRWGRCLERSAGPRRRGSST